MDTPQPAAKASTKKKKMKEKGTSHETKEWERRWRRGTPGIYLVPLVHLGAALDLPITPVASAVAHWTPRPKKRTDMEGCRADSPRQRYLA